MKTSPSNSALRPLPAPRRRSNYISPGSRGGLNSVLRKSPEEKPDADEAQDCEERNEPAILAERGLSAIQSPRKPNSLSHCIFECLIIEASSRAQNHLSVLADRYTKRCRGVFDCTGDG